MRIRHVPLTVQLQKAKFKSDQIDKTKVSYFNKQLINKTVTLLPPEQKSVKELCLISEELSDSGPVSWTGYKLKKEEAIIRAVQIPFDFGSFDFDSTNVEQLELHSSCFL